MIKISNCINCGLEKRYDDRTQTGKYCNNKCQIEYQYKTKMLPLILEGKANNTGALKKYLKENFGNFCILCKQGEIHNGLPLVLQLDHIDGNSDNNQVDNLRLLCPNCHTQTETYGSKKGKKETKRNSYLRKYKGY